MGIQKIQLQELRDQELTCFFNLVLDLYSASTHHAIALHDDVKLLWCNSNDHFSPLCAHIRNNKKIWKLCEDDHNKRAKNTLNKNFNGNINLCHLGLWNIAYPVIYDDQTKITLLTGQVRIRNHRDDHKSRHVLQNSITQYISKGLLTSLEATDIMNFFEKVKIIDSFEKYFKKHIIESEHKIKEILNYIFDRINRRLKRMTLLRHEIHLPNVALRGKINEVIRDISNSSILDEGFRNISSSKLRHARNHSVLFSFTIENILSSLSRDTVKITTKRENIIDILEEAQSLFAYDAEQRQIKISKIIVSSTIKSIEVDKSLIMRVFINAYQNAIKYSFDGSKDRIRTIETYFSETKDFIVIQISNFGIGILKEEISTEEIWKEGVRGLLSSDRLRTGSGLGLYQIKSIIDAHHGQVELESNPLTSDEVTGPYLTNLTIRLPYIDRGWKEK